MNIYYAVNPGEKWHHGKLEFMLSQRGKPLLVHDSHTFGIQYIRKDKKYWQCNLSRKYNCKARVTTTEGGDIIVTNNEHCHTEIRQHLRKEYKLNRLHNMSQSLLQQHALQINLNRLSAVAQRQTQQQQAPIGSPMPPPTQDQQQMEALQMAKSLAQASLKLENNHNNEQDIDTHKNGDQPEMGRHEKEYSGAADEELSKRVLPDWKEEIFRNASMREDIKWVLSIVKWEP